jgi:hypothetical protein
MANLRHDGGVPNIVLVGMPNVAALRRVSKKLEVNQIPHYDWIEPDHDFGFTAIATAPIWGEQREALKNYRVYHTPVAQLRECPALNGEAVGENPTGRAMQGEAATSAAYVAKTTPCANFARVAQRESSRL